LGNKNIYDNKDLQAPVGDVREVEQKTFEATAKDGPSGPLYKPLSEADETTSKEEHELKKQIQRAYVNYKFKKSTGKI
jgi:hypothetical protein